MWINGLEMRENGSIGVEHETFRDIYDGIFSSDLDLCIGFARAASHRARTDRAPRPTTKRSI